MDKGKLLSLLTWAEINLDSLKYNIKAIKKHVGEGVQVIAVVKANAYGHGAVMIAKSALSSGAERLAVHRAEEGIALRKAGIKAPILIMGYTPVQAASEVVEYSLTPTVVTLEFAREISLKNSILKRSTSVPIHIKVDTGMGRFGLLPDEVPSFCKALEAIPGIKIEGIFTHFATADASDQTYLRNQLATFNNVLKELKKSGTSVPMRHACNSAATMILPEAHFDAVRPGISIYGLNPSDEWEPPFTIHPVLSLKSRVVRIRTLPAGSCIGYGYTFTTPRAMKVALVPLGYGDGYHRILSNRGEVLIRGSRARILGRVSMDQIVVDVDHIPSVEMEDEVVLVGRQGTEVIRSEEVAKAANTINYEVTTSLLPRVARVYILNNEIDSIERIC
mgnify:CR=1 FL=1